MSRLERRYRLLLRAYPGDYRADYGDELLDVLLTRAEADRVLPPAREAAALVVGGVRTRITEAAQGHAWVDGTHLAVTALSLVQVAVLIPYAGSIPLWVAIAGVAFLCVLRGWIRPALALSVLTAAKVTAITLGVQIFDPTLLPIFPDPPWQNTDALYMNGGPYAPATSSILLILGLMALAIRGEPLRHRSWWWLAAVPLVAGADPAWHDIVAGDPGAMLRVGLETALLCGAAYAGHLTGDARWALAAGVYALPCCAILVENLLYISRQEVAHGMLIVLLALIAAAVPYRARRRILL
ncbi:hypothetical protein OIE66_01930 [Nonomuraea sp. NBC_01738]|uniref:hypothetical protein n=1 Tax=Nonomuraea sp. NBC_01738 TaxID=2976003 RepID=UPI002E0FD0C1|nr:hypothetical protein OIE66_01930 [Nonomuraea sp. NBC_01738]